MKQFTFIFRQGRRVLSADEQQQRAREVREWALEQVREKRKLDPHILGDGGCQLTADGAATPTPLVKEGSIIAILFMEAADLNGAVAMARTHPGLRYGSSIEVREWSPPPALPATDAVTQ